MSTQTFDPLAYIKQRDEDEAAKRQAANEGKPAPVKPEAKVETKAPEAKIADDLEEPEKAHMQLPRSARREINRLRDEAGELRGRLATLQEMIDKSGVKAPVKEEAVAEDPEAKPERAKFATDAEHIEALSAWTVRQENKKIESQRAWVDHVKSMYAKHDDDVKLIPDFDAHMALADKEGDPNFVGWNPSEHQNLMMWMAGSPYQALIRDYFALNPEELKELLALPEKSEKQGRVFVELDGFFKMEYRKLKSAKLDPKGEDGGKEAGKPEKEPAKAAPKLPKPSESASVRGGSAPAMTVSPVLADGKTLNPVWAEQQNQRRHNR